MNVNNRIITMKTQHNRKSLSLCLKEKNTVQHLDGFLLGAFIVVGLFVLLGPLGEVGVVGYFIEER